MTLLLLLRPRWESIVISDGDWPWDEGGTSANSVDDSPSSMYRVDEGTNSWGGLDDGVTSWGSE